MKVRRQVDPTYPPLPVYPPLSAIARDEVWRWTRKGTMPEGLVMAILFCFVHRLTTGKTFEETFCTGNSIATDYQI